MNGDDLKKVIEEIDVLLFLAEKGVKERKFFAWQMFVWGMYGFINMLFTLFNIQEKIPGTLWFHTVFVAFFLSTIPVAGLKASLMWFLGYVLTVLVSYSKNYSLTVLFMVFIITILSAIIYGKLSKWESRKPSLTAYIGIFWGLIFGSFWFNIGVLNLDFGAYLNAWIAQLFSACIFISGVIIRVLMIFGVILLFAFPILLKMGDFAYLTGYTVSALILSLTGLSYYLKR